MNSKRRIVVVAVLGTVVLGLTAGWNVLAADAWPPEPYQVPTWAGAHTLTDGTGALGTLLITPPDPRTGEGFSLVTWIVFDPTMNGLFPEATSVSQGFSSYVETAPDGYRVKLVMYVLKDTKPKATILGIVVKEGTATYTAREGRTEGTLSVYSPTSDTDGDGLPDADAKPLVSFPIAGLMKRI